MRRIRYLLLAVLFAVPSPPAVAAGPPALPDTAAGRRAAALAAFVRDGGDVERFVTENYAASALTERPAKDRAVTLRQVFSDVGRGELVAVEDLGPSAIAVTFKAASGGLWIRFELACDAAPPHGVTGMRIGAEDTPPAPGGASGSAVEPPAPAAPLSEAAALAAIRSEIQSAAAADTFSGVVMVARAGQPLLHEAVGLADRGRGVPIARDTKFNIGSINKIFTAIVIRQLEAEGKLRVDAPLAAAWPDYPNREVAERVTIAQLLEHRAGLGDVFGERFGAARERLRTVADYLPLFVDAPLLFAPGSAQRYSNAGYVVLGLVIEKLTGMSYYDAVRARIYGPAGMTASDSYARDEAVPNLAIGYTSRQPRADPAGAAAPHRNDDSLPARGSSAGGGYSTAEDLLRFATALRAGKLGDSQRHQRAGGLGIAGGTDGCNAVLEDDWERGWTVIVLANVDPPAAEAMSRKIRAVVARVGARVGAP